MFNPAVPYPPSLAVRCPACNAAPGVRCLVDRRIAHRIRTATADQSAGRPLSRRLAATLARWAPMLAEQARRVSR